MRDNIKKLIDLIKTENWRETCEISSTIYSPRNKKYPYISNYGVTIDENSTIFFKEDESRYFYDLITIMKKEREDQALKLAMYKLDEFLKSK